LKFNKYQWAAIAAGLLSPALYFLIKKEIQRVEQASKAQKNLRAFLIMIQYSEGTLGKDAYRKLFGGGLFTDFSKHPDMPVTRGSLTSTAAGAYQILYKTWLEVQQKLGLPDFSPSSQDKAAIELIKRRKALEDVLAGKFSQAIEKCRKEWASLPGAGYNQRERSANSLLSVYKIAGGTAIAA
jgi:muramidase (phage lysozyme)